MRWSCLSARRASPRSGAKRICGTARAAIPGVKVLIDENGTEAGLFDAHVSGQVLLYDTEGKLVFHGGITESRGQAGDNAGRAAIESIVNQGTSDRDQTPVFGCPLFDPDSVCRKPSHATLNR